MHSHIYYRDCFHCLYAIVSDVESIADQVIILRKGKVLDMKAPVELLTLVSGKVCGLSMFLQKSKIT